jgi:secondary thiamine-phosphate synthase enzyme
MKTIDIRTSKRQEIVDITSLVQNCVKESEVISGIACIFVPHTTAGVTINENADPDVVADLNDTFNKTFPKRPDYKHYEGNSDSHVKSSVVGASLTVIVEDGQLQLGTWQSIYFFEFDGARNRQCWVKLISDK